MSLDPHAQYIQDVVCLRLTLPGEDIDPERLVRALRHLRSRECSSCRSGQETGRVHSNEAEFLEMCKEMRKEPQNPVHLVQELVDAINAKYSRRRRMACDDGVA